MAEENKIPDGSPDRRRRTEEMLLKSHRQPGKIRPADMERTFHELEVHQIELEMQNHELRRTQQALEASREKYFDLYDLAPVGYVTLNENGLVLETNLTAAALLGKDRSNLVGLPLSYFVFREDQATYDHHHKRLFETCQRQECEIRMQKGDGSQLWVRLEAVVVRGNDGESASRTTLSDITRNKMAEEALNKLRHQNELILDTVREGIFGLDLEGHITFVNPSAARMLRYEVTELVGRHSHPMLHHSKPDGSAYPKSECPICAAFTDGVIHLLENEVFWRKDGSSFPVRYISTPIIDGNIIKGAVVSFSDITEQKEAQERLQRAAEQRRLAMESAELGAWDYNFNTGDVFWDERCRDMFGVAIGRQMDYDAVLARMHHEDRSTIDKAVKDAIAGSNGGAYDQEFRVVWPDGSIHWVASHGRVYFEGQDDSRQAVRFIGVNSDITDRKQAEAELQENRHFVQKILDTTPNLIYIHDLIENKNVYANREVLSFLGFTPEQIRAMGPDLLRTILHPDDIAHVARHHARLALAGDKEVFEIEYRVRQADGQWRWLHRRGVLFSRSEDGIARQILGTAEDITEQKLHREQLRELYIRHQAIREEERANIAREMHDELGQIMVAVRMNLAWIQKEYRDRKGISEKSLEILELIDGTIKSIRRICTELRPDLLDHLGLGAAIEWQAEEFAKKSGIPCNVAVEGGIHEDNDRAIALFRIFQEALTNVMRYADATKVTASLRRKGGKVILKISDNGKGITEDDISKPGSFGLLDMRERVYPWNGMVTIETNPDGGTTIEVILPDK